MTGTLAGAYFITDGEPREGFVVVTPSVPVIYDSTGRRLLSGAVVEPLVQGAFTVELPPTDDTTLDPAGVTYTVEVHTTGGHYPAVTGVAVPDGEQVWAPDQTPVDPAAPTYAQQVTRAEFDALAASVAQVNATQNSQPAAPVIDPTLFLLNFQNGLI